MQSYSLLFADDNNETHLGAVNSIALWDEVLSDSTIQNFDGPTAAGIPIPELASVIFILTTLLGFFVRK